MKVRDGTENEELIGVKRHFVYELRNKLGRNNCPGIGQPVYYDIAILELGTYMIDRIQFQMFGKIFSIVFWSSKIVLLKDFTENTLKNKAHL